MDNYKEVFFSEYCKTCEHKDIPGDEEPCNECLTIGARQYSHKPEKWKEASDK